MSGILGRPVIAWALVPLAAALLGRQWWAAGVAGAACVALALCVLPRAVATPSTGGSRSTVASRSIVDGVLLTVMSTNMRVGAADAQAIVDVVRTRDVDVLAVQELTPDADTDLIRAGLLGVLAHSQRHPAEGVGGSAVYSRFPLTGGGVKINPDGEFRQAYAVVLIPGGAPVAVESVHPVPPVDANSIPSWTQCLRDQTSASPAGPPRILAGDFNATLDHVELRRVLDTGYRDAASEVGAGLTPSWPYYGRRAAVTPKITIDHIFVDEGITVLDFSAYAIPGTDHRAILAILAVPVSS